jgi:predicted nucleic acid-binding protein
MEYREVLIDTSLEIDYLRNADKPTTKFISLFKAYDLYISVITVFELLNGATTEEKLTDIRKIFNTLTTIDIDVRCAEKASEIYRELKIQNKLIEFRDILIGATAIVNNLPVATLNKKHFERLRDITII